jgi:DNA repair exonuclease SbcCD ATPase subunit
VIVNGELNGVKFAISRMKTLSRGGLTFMFGGDDLTAQSVQETQKVINEKLGISAELLSRTLFHGQHSLNGLLESTDTKLKDELSLIVPLDIWQKAASLARKQSSAASKVEAQLDGMISVRSADLDNARGKLNFTSEQMENARLRKDASLATLKEFAVALSSESEKVTQTKSLDSLNSELFSCEAFILELEKELSSAKVLLDQDLATCEGEIKTLESSLADLEALERNVYHEQQVILGHLEVAKERLARLETMWKVDLSHGVPKNFRLPKECPTCSQAINDVNHSHQDENLQLSVVESMTLAFMEHEKTIRQAEERTEEVQTTRDRTNSMRKEVGQMIQDRDKRARKWTIEIGEIESNLHRERNRQRELSKQLSELASSIDRDLQKASLEAALQEASEKVRYLEMTVDSVREQVTKLEETLFELNIQRDQHSRSSVVMSELSQLFSPKGIQSFILKNTIADLETATQSFLTEISDGTQQLHLSLESGEGISRRAFVTGNGGNYMERPLGSLSGGQWRRCSLALNFGFAELIARIGNFRSSLCILDEPLTHLDRSGRSDVGRLLRKFVRQSQSGLEGTALGLSFETVLIILQDLAAEELEESFDSVDQVIKRGSVSSVVIDGGL